MEEVVEGERHLSEAGRLWDVSLPQPRLPYHEPKK